MLSVKLRARGDARNEDYPPSDRVVIRKKKETVPVEIVIRKGRAARNKLKPEVSGRPRAQSSLTRFY